MDRKRWVPPMVSRLIVGDEETVVCLEIDDTRKRLYTLSSNSYVTVYSIEGSPNSAASVVREAVLVNRRPAPPARWSASARSPRRGGADRTQPTSAMLPCARRGHLLPRRRPAPRLLSDFADRAGHERAGVGGGDGGGDGGRRALLGDMVLLAHNGNYLDRAGRAAAERPRTATHRNDAILHCVHATGHDRLHPPGRGSAVPEPAPLVNSGVLALAEVPMELIIPRKLHAMVATEWSLPELASQATLASMIARTAATRAAGSLHSPRPGCTASSAADRPVRWRWRRAGAPCAQPRAGAARVVQQEEMYCMLLRRWRARAARSPPRRAPPAPANFDSASRPCICS